MSLTQFDNCTVCKLFHTNSKFTNARRELYLGGGLKGANEPIHFSRRPASRYLCLQDQSPCIAPDISVAYVKNRGLNALFRTT